MDERTQIAMASEKEWRIYLVTKLDKLQEDVTILKIKVATIGSAFGFISGIISSFIMKKMDL